VPVSVGVRRIPLHSLGGFRANTAPRCGSVATLAAVPTASKLQATIGCGALNGAGARTVLSGMVVVRRLLLHMALCWCDSSRPGSSREEPAG
jgi:hypothetical protein